MPARLEETLTSSSNQECRCSFLKTKGLIESFKQSEPISLGKQFNYLFKVISRGNVHSLTSSQFNAKLRADIQIEIIPLFKVTKSDSQTITSRIIVLGMMSKFLYFYNFLYENKCYILKSTECLPINFLDYKWKQHIKEANTVIDTPNKLLIMNESHIIIDEHEYSLKQTIDTMKGFLKSKPLKKTRYFNFFFTNFNRVQKDGK